MKKLISTLITLVMLLSTLVGCSGGDKGTTQAPAGSTEKQYADMIVVGETADVRYMDPNQAIGAVEMRTLNYIYEGLVRENQEGSGVIPLLSESWTISEDGLTYTFKLKPDVKFQDGTPVTGEDWVWSLYRARDEKASNSRTAAEPIDTVTAPDAATLVIKLKKPTPAFLAYLCKWNMVVASKKHFDKVGPEAFLKSPMGTGPYGLEEWKKGEYYTLKKNEYYHVKGLPLTNKIKYVILSDDNARLLQLKAGQIDIMPAAPVQMMGQIKADSNLVAISKPSTQIRMLILNTTVAPFNNPKVREAIGYLTDKQAIADISAAGYAKPVASYVSYTHGDFFNKDLKNREVDVEKAKQLLSEAGFANGVKATISYATGQQVYEDIATTLKSQWAAAGIDLTLEPLESGAMVDKVHNLKHQAALQQWTDSTPDPADISAYACRYADAQQWGTGLNDKEIEDLFLKTLLETDHANRVQEMHDLQQKVFDRGALIPVFQADFTYGVSKKLENFDFTPFNKINSYNLRKVK